MRNNGGFLLIKINKLLSNITASDFDIKWFDKIFEEHIMKPVVLETTNYSCILNTGMGNHDVYLQHCNPYYDPDTHTLDGLIQINIEYNYNTKDLVVGIEEF